MNTPKVTRLRDIDPASLQYVLRPYGLKLVEVPDGKTIPGSFWGDSEAGLIGGQLLVRPDTPVHSALHEACHFICMSAARRAVLHRDAGGDCAEEDAVCYLQILLADRLAGAGWSRDRMLADMDAWGYSFRLGSARRWFEGDAEEARDWLAGRGLLPVPVSATNARGQATGFSR